MSNNVSQKTINEARELLKQLKEVNNGVSNILVKYMIYPGEVISKTDGQKRYLGFDKLCELYKVHKLECKNAANYYDISTIDKNKFIHLYPDPMGEYKIPTKTLSTKESLEQYVLSHPDDITALSALQDYYRENVSEELANELGDLRHDDGYYTRSSEYLCKFCNRDFDEVKVCVDKLRGIISKSNSLNF